MKAVALILAAVIAAAPALADDVTISGKARVLDGDTLAMGSVRIRLHGIDAAEDGQTCNSANGQTWDCAKAATERLAGLIGDQKVECSVQDRDRYGRLVAVCFAEGVNLNERLVSDGLAWAYRQYSTEYVEVETAAKAAGRGIWQTKTTPPWQWRAEKRNKGNDNVK